MTLVKKITKIGNSYGIILPHHVLKLVGLKPGGECLVDADKDKVSIRPSSKLNKTDQRVMEAMTKFIKKYRKDLQRLA